MKEEGSEAALEACSIAGEGCCCGGIGDDLRMTTGSGTIAGLAVVGSGDVRSEAKGNWVSSKTTCLEVMTHRD